MAAPGTSTGTATGIRPARAMTGCSSLATPRASALSDPEPQRRGLREATPISGTARAHLADQDIPAPADELADLLHAAFRELVGTDLASDLATPVQREQYARSGMSSGMISLDTWRERLMPMFSERATARLPSLPRITGPPDTTGRYPIRYASPPSTRRNRRSARPAAHGT
jgi:hypothetical protein